MSCLSHRWLLTSLAGASALIASSLTARANELASSPDRTVRAFLAAHGTDLRVTWDFNTGYPSHIFGHAMDLGARPNTDAEFARLALDIFDRYPGLGGFDSRVLQVSEVDRMDLERIGSSNKVGVVLQQIVDGLEVEQGTVSVIFDEASGKVLSIQNDALPGVASIDVLPSLDETEAIAIAKEKFGFTVREVKGADLMIVANGERSGALLAWNVELVAEEADHDLPIIQKLSIDANTGSEVRRENRVHALDLLLWSRTWATPGNKPDTSANPEVLFDGQYVFHTSAVGNDHSDVVGDVVIPYGGTSVQTVTSSFNSSSLYARVTNQSGSAIQSSKSVTPGSRTELRINKARTALGTAQTNAQHHVINFREFVKSINGSGNPFNFQVRANANISSTCNAYYDGVSVNFYKAGGGCVNTAYSTVVSHEEGHWANDLWGSGNGGDGFGEGNGDNFATYINDTAIVGQDFCGTGCNIRTGENGRSYCGSCGAGCYGEVHADGEVLMGACWKVRKRLNTSLGDAAGDLIADTLLVRWMEGYNDKTICKAIRDHWLVLDDDDANLSNGTPHKADIDGGFVDQGFPPF